MNSNTNTKRHATEPGNYFIANYPPFSFWNDAHLAALDRRLGQAAPSTPFGLYVHLPFCRKRCDFCYFKVYTDRNAHEIRGYLDAVVTETRLYAEKPYLHGRRPRFVYFGGGTPSYLSITQLDLLFAGLREVFPWDDAEEVTFECEPGTLSESKIHWLKEAGVTRLSLGVENFSPELLEINNRAHRAKEIFTAYAAARDAAFPQVNLDLIAGMVGETDANWRDCIDRTIELRPESVTIYQMEVPYNTTLYRRMDEDGASAAPVADWETKRRWTGEAFAAFERAGYRVGSAYTVKVDDDVRFLYRDALWTGADLLGIGVSSFSHLGGVHAQCEHRIEPYVERVTKGELPVLRALELSDDERLIREFILQLKLGVLDLEPFRRKFGVDPAKRFAEPLAAHATAGHLSVEEDRIVVSRRGLLQIDRLLQDYFLEEHRGARYA